jgi:hypothetical protein
VESDSMIGHPLPTNWYPSVEDILYGMGLGLTGIQIDGMAEDMKLWAAANANRAVARKSNWTAAFRGWMRREATKRGTNGSSNPTIDAFNRIINCTASHGIEDGTIRTDNPTGGGQGGETVDWLFPPRKTAGP